MKHTTIGLVVTLALGLLTAPLCAEAQQPGKIPRVGVLSPFISSADLLLETFRQGLREIGYMEGQNIAIEYRSAEGRTDRLPDLAAELVRLKVDIIVTTGAPAVQAAKGVTSTIPIVMAAVGDAVEYGFVTSLARPGGNIIGSSWLNTELTSKRLELFKEALPEMSRVAALWDSATGAAYFRPMEAAARSLAVQLQALEVRGPDDFDSAFQDARKGGAGGLVILPSPFFYAHRVRLVGLEATNRLPAMYFRREFVEAGGLMSYGPNFSELYRRAAYYVDRILKGAKPADLPVEQPMKFELVINIRTAQALGLTISPLLLFRADEVIQ
ncbi:MAG: ABC transporter substrate-binding protein [Candidatus Entotheonellia bacterium]|jgi:putative ABC transport system substrate-binding protein